MNKLTFLLLLPILSHSQPIRFYHYIGLNRIENDFIIVEDNYKLYVIKFGEDTINMSFTRIDLDKGHIWYCNNFSLLELEIIEENGVIRELVFYDDKKRLFYKYFKKGTKI